MPSMTKSINLTPFFILSPLPLYFTICVILNIKVLFFASGPPLAQPNSVAGLIQFHMSSLW